MHLASFSFGSSREEDPKEDPDQEMAHPDAK